MLRDSRCDILSLLFIAEKFSGRQHQNCAFLPLFKTALFYIDELSLSSKFVKKGSKGD
jgi:hypothetical protein